MKLTMMVTHKHGLRGTGNQLQLKIKTLTSRPMTISAASIGNKQINYFTIAHESIEKQNIYINCR